MNITIINGTPDPGDNLIDKYIMDITYSLGNSGNVTRFDLRKMKIRNCTGCWNCWTRTPGECSTRDDSASAAEAMINSSFVLFVTPLIMGFPSALLKKLHDRTICLLHPYIEIVQGEMHHKNRYDRYPGLGLIVRREEDTDDEDLSIVQDIYRRLALNFKTELKIFKTVDEGYRSAADEINNY